MADDAKTVFSTAEVFREGSQILSNHLPNVMFPWVMCSSFSLELYLKCLILIEGGAATGHNLETLFRKRISGDSQDAIRANYEKKRAQQDAIFAAAVAAGHMPPPPKSNFDFVLHASAEAFTRFRYAYEGLVGNQQGWLAGQIGECVRERIIELNPDWANVR
jgi:hypothetical protein